MENYSENPSGKIKGLGPIKFIVFILVVFGGYYLMYRDTFNEILEEIKSEFNYNYDYNYNTDEDFEGTFVAQYMDENEYVKVQKPSLITLDESRTLTTGIDDYQYLVEYSEMNRKLKLSEVTNSYSYIDYEEPRGGNPWRSLVIYKINNTVLIKIEHDVENTYLFVDCSYNLRPIVKFQTTSELEPTLASNNKLYFGSVEEDGNHVYSYDTITSYSKLEEIK